MASAAREYLMVVEESAFNTPAASPTIWTTATSYGLANAQAYYCRLDGSNAFTMRPKPKIKQIMYGGGVAKPAISVSDKTDCAGTLKFELCIGQAPFWLSWALSAINSAQTAPWTTTEPPNDLASCSIYHAIVADNGTVKRRVYGGVKPTSFGLEVGVDNTTITVTIGLIGSTPEGNFVSGSDPVVGTFPIPLETYFPVDPYVFIQGNGHLTLGGTSRTIVDTLSWKCANAIATKFGPNRYAQMIRCLGRTIDMDATFLYSLSPDDRTNYESLTAETASIEFTNGTHSFTLNMESTNYWTDLMEDLPIDGIYMFKGTGRPMFDTTAGSDLTLTIT